MNVMHSSENVEHYTPLPIITAARHTFDADIELDPASSETANSIVKAQRFYTVTDNGLTCNWEANTVFLNPPGGRYANKSLAALFWDKLLYTHQIRKVKQAIFVGFSLELLAKRASSMLDYPICVPCTATKTPDLITGSGRIMFLTPELKPNKNPTHGNIIVYLPPILEYSNYQCDSAAVSRFVKFFSP